MNCLPRPLLPGLLLLCTLAALPARGDAVPSSPSPEPLEEVLYTLSLEDSGAGTLAITSRYRGPRAQQVREQLTALSLEQLASRRLELRRTLFPQLQPQGSPRVEEDERAGVLTLQERYALQGAWSQERLKLSLPRLGEQLNLPPLSESPQPLEVTHPVHLRERWEVLSKQVLAQARQQTVEGPASRLEVDIRPHPTGASLQVDYRTLSASVAASQVPLHAQVVTQMRELTSVTLPTVKALAPSFPGGPAPTSPAEALPSRTTNLLISLALLLGLAVWWGRVPQRLRRWYKARQAAPRPTPTRLPPREPLPLEPPTQLRGPFTVDSLEQAEARARTERCSCGGHLLRGPTQQSGSGSRSKALIHMRCLACNAPLVLSFDIRPN